GRNPLPAAGRLLVALADLQDRLQKAHPTHEHLGDVYVTPTVSRAGSLDQINVIPARATVAVDVRTIPGVDHGELVARVRELAAEFVEVDDIVRCAHVYAAAADRFLR